MDQLWIHAIINAHAIDEKNVNPGVGMLDRRGAWVCVWGRNVLVKIIIK